MKLIDDRKFEAACTRLAWRALRKRLPKLEKENGGPLTIPQMNRMVSRAFRPRAYVLMAKRVFARGWIIFNAERHEVIRDFGGGMQVAIHGE